MADHYCLSNLEQQLVRNKVKYSGLDADRLWGSLPVNEDAVLFCILKNLLLKCSQVPVASFFPDSAPRRLINIMKEDHGPQVYVLAIGLIGYLCNVSSQMKMRLVRQGLVLQLKRLLADHCSSASQRSSPHSMVLQLAEQVTSLLLYMSLGPGMCIEAMTFDGLVEPLVDMLNLKNCQMFGFHPKAKSAFEELVLFKDLVGCCQTESSDETNELILNTFGEACYKLNLPQTVYTVDLYDTSSTDDLKIAEELQKQKLIWVEGGFSDSDFCDNWQDIHVTNVTSGDIFWALLGGQATQSSLQEIKVILNHSHPSPESLAEWVPSAGMLVRAAHDKLGALRGQLASVDQRASVCLVWALDYGLTFDAKLRDLSQLPAELASIPPLTTLCRLKGSCPRPFNDKVIDNVLFTLCNLAQHTNITSSCFMDCNAHTNILQFITSCPDLRLTSSALRIISNLAREEIVRHKLGWMVSDLLGACHRWSEVDLDRPQTHLQVALAALANLLFENQDAKETYIKDEGPVLCMRLLEDKVNCHIQSASLQVLRVFVGVASINNDRPRRRNQFREPHEREAVKRVEGVLDKLEHQRAAGVCDGRARSRFQWGRNLNESWPVVTRVVDPSLMQDSSDEAPDKHPPSLPQPSSPPTPPSPLVTSSNNTTSTPDVSSGSEMVEETRTNYKKGERVSFTQDSFHELVQAKRLHDVSASMVTKIACGFLNAGRRCSLWFGIDSISVVDGVALSRDDKDELRIGLTKAMDKLQPPLPSTHFTITFFPVVDCHIDTYVVRVIFDPRNSSTFSFMNEAYLRKGKETRCLSFNEVRSRAIMMASRGYIDEMKHLKEERDSLRLLLENLDSKA